MSGPEARAARALEWIMRLPLLGEPELAWLLGVDVADVPVLRHALERAGWTESFVPGSSALRPRRLSFVREEALTDLARLLRVEPEALSAHLPVRRSDLLARIVRVEITAGVNRFLAALAGAPGAPGLELEDARSLPLAARPRERWWLPGVEGYGCLRAGSLRAPFLVAWDRAGAPDEHRRRRLGAWLASAAAAAARWGPAGPPPVLLVCAGWRARAAWERALERSAERAGGRPVEILLANAREVAAAGPAGVIWRDPTTGRAGSLLERLGWGLEPGIPRVRLPDGVTRLPRRPTAPGLRQWALGAAADSRTPAGARTAAIAMTTDGDEKRLLGWVGHWPLVTARQLASLAGVPEAAVQRRIERLLCLGAVRADEHAAPGEPPGARLVLAPPGLRLLARREGVPPARYARFAGVGAPGTGSPSGAVRHRAHQLGVNRVMARLAADARAAGGRLSACRNEARSTRRFRHGGRAAWIRPDGSGVIASSGGRVPFLLEYDRGTLDSGDFAGKFGGYLRYYAARAWRRDWSSEPALLFVCADDRAEHRVARAAWRAGPRCDVRVPLLLTSEWRFAQRRPVPAGLMGPVWWSPCAEAADPERRTALVLRSRGPGRSHDNDLPEGGRAHD